jgi:hypothetical protein
MMGEMDMVARCSDYQQRTEDRGQKTEVREQIVL